MSHSIFIHIYSNGHIYLSNDVNYTPGVAAHYHAQRHRKQQPDRDERYRQVR
jgi:hypothetical protein